jgi:tetratricopeptide (TPR) repeat protein
MFIDGVDNYQKSLQYQSRCRQAADRYRLARQVTRSSPTIHSLNWHLWQSAFAIIVVVIALALLIVTQPVSAHDVPQFEPGEGTLFHDAMVAFTLGRYYNGVEDYGKALGYLEECLELLPEVVFEVAPEDYANVYRVLGKTQSALGDEAAAHVSFERYLTLAGDGADPVIVIALSATDA